MTKDHRDYSFLINEKITQLLFGINFVSLIFENGYIQISNGFSLKVQNVLSIYDEIFPIINDFGLLILLEQRIIEVNITPESGTLILFFENEIELSLFKDIMYESYEVFFKGDRIII